MKVFIESYGCTFNQADGQIIAGNLLENDIDFSHFTGLPQGRQLRTPENIFIENSTAAQKVLRRHYKEGNYSPYRCAICG